MFFQNLFLLFQYAVSNTNMSRSSYKVLKSRRMKWAVRVSLVGGKLTVKRPLRRPMLSWENNTKINFQEIVLGGCGLDSRILGEDTWQALMNLAAV